jgi:hypothetical protein
LPEQRAVGGADVTGGPDHKVRAPLVRNIRHAVQSDGLGALVVPPRESM